LPATHLQADTETDEQLNLVTVDPTTHLPKIVPKDDDTHL